MNRNGESEAEADESKNPFLILINKIFGVDTQERRIGEKDGGNEQNLEKDTESPVTVEIDETESDVDLTAKDSTHSDRFYEILKEALDAKKESKNDNDEDNTASMMYGNVHTNEG